MCGRFTLTERDRNVVETRLGLPSGALGLYIPRYNIAPTQFHCVVTPGISPKTAQAHRENIKDKLDLRSTAELVRYAIKHRIVKTD